MLLVIKSLEPSCLDFVGCCRELQQQQENLKKDSRSSGSAILIRLFRLLVEIVIDHPVDAELISKHAEVSSPKSFV